MPTFTAFSRVFPRYHDHWTDDIRDLHPVPRDDRREVLATAGCVEGLAFWSNRFQRYTTLRRFWRRAALDWRAPAALRSAALGMRAHAVWSAKARALAPMTPDAADRYVELEEFMARGGWVPDYARTFWIWTA
jgi:hypothetical protein